MPLRLLTELNAGQAARILYIHSSTISRLWFNPSENHYYSDVSLALPSKIHIQWMICIIGGMNWYTIWCICGIDIEVNSWRSLKSIFLKVIQILLHVASSKFPKTKLWLYANKSTMKKHMLKIQIVFWQLSIIVLMIIFPTNYLLIRITGKTRFSFYFRYNKASENWQFREC